MRGSAPSASHIAMNTFDGSTVLALAVTGIVFGVLLYVWIGLALSALFRKSGEEPWKGWVPILNLVVVLQLGGLSGWLFLLVLVPFIGPLARLGVHRHRGAPDQPRLRLRRRHDRARGAAVPGVGDRPRCRVGALDRS